MKIRATNEALGELAVRLVSGPDHVDFEFFDRLDDVSLQTLNTLVSQCPYCGDWTRLEDGDCTCSHSEQQYYCPDDITFSLENGYHDPSELEELPEE